MNILKNYYKNNPSIKINAENKVKAKSIQANEAVLDKYSQYKYILDSSLSEYDILTRYINDNKGYQFITTEELIEILKET